MTPQVDCTEAVAALLGVVESGGTIAEEQREHLRTCERCKELLASAREFQSALTAETKAPEVTADAAALEREVALARRKRIAAKTLLAMMIVGFFGFFLLLLQSAGHPTGESLAIVVGGVFLATLIALPVVLLIVAVRGVTKPRDGRRIYRRLGPGRQISGVCVGLSEAYGMRVEVLRLLFVIAAFFKGFGLLVYILFALVMPVHPDDRQYMLRFKLRRAFGGNR